ncbi:MAG: adenine phosphoribosyltransferase [Bacteroidota bacterium]|nr:adenine phosphoribosyltransferase [Bacteroidota bacterium]
MNLADEIKNAIRDVPDFPKPGILFKDITPIFYDQTLCNKITEEFERLLAPVKPDVIVGVESRGFLFGILLANKMNLPFVLVRKAGKLPYTTISQEYSLEYGTAKIEMHTDSIKKGAKVVIHDDLLATGGTAAATADLIKQFGAEVSAFTFIVGLDFLGGKEKLNKHTNNIQCLVHY